MNTTKIETTDRLERQADAIRIREAITLLDQSCTGYLLVCSAYGDPLDELVSHDVRGAVHTKGLNDWVDRHNMIKSVSDYVREENNKADNKSLEMDVCGGPDIQVEKSYLHHFFDMVSHHLFTLSNAYYNEQVEP